LRLFSCAKEPARLSTFKVNRLHEQAVKFVGFHDNVVIQTPADPTDASVKNDGPKEVHSFVVDLRSDEERARVPSRKERRAKRQRTQKAERLGL
jgi:hypothetical protein